MKGHQVVQKLPRTHPEGKNAWYRAASWERQNWRSVGSCSRSDVGGEWWKEEGDPKVQLKWLRGGLVPLARLREQRRWRSGLFKES